MNMNRLRAGFTLVELAIVLLIIGVISGLLLSNFGAKLDVQKHNEDKQMLEDIKVSLINYVTTNGFLPCPDTSDPIADPNGVGRENRNGLLECSASSGNLPFSDLETHPETAHGFRFSYHINRETVNPPVSVAQITEESASYFRNPTGYGCPRYCFNRATPPTANFSGIGNININNGTINVAENVLAVVISHGKNNCTTNPNAAGTIPADPSFEIRNCNYNSPVYYQAQQDNNFDDILTWVTSLEVKHSSGMTNIIRELN